MDLEPNFYSISLGLLAALAQRSPDLFQCFLFGNFVGNSVRTDLDTDRSYVVSQFDKSLVSSIFFRTATESGE